MGLFPTIPSNFETSKYFTFEKIAAKIRSEISNFNKNKIENSEMTRFSSILKF